MEFKTLVDTLVAAFGLQGMIAAVIILLAVFAAKLTGLVATGNQARIANVIVSAILYGLSADPAAENGLTAVLASLIAALMFELLDYARKKITPEELKHK